MDMRESTNTHLIGMSTKTSDTESNYSIKIHTHPIPSTMAPSPGYGTERDYPDWYPYNIQQMGSETCADIVWEQVVLCYTVSKDGQRVPYKYAIPVKVDPSTRSELILRTSHTSLSLTWMLSDDRSNKACLELWGSDIFSHTIYFTTRTQAEFIKTWYSLMAYIGGVDKVFKVGINGRQLLDYCIEHLGAIKIPDNLQYTTKIDNTNVRHYGFRSTTKPRTASR